MDWPITARVRNGRLIVDEPVDLPEGTVIDLAPMDDEDGLDEEDRARLHAELDRSEEDVRAGRVIPAEEVFRAMDAIRPKK